MICKQEGCNLNSYGHDYCILHRQKPSKQKIVTKQEQDTKEAVKQKNKVIDSYEDKVVKETKATKKPTPKNKEAAAGGIRARRKKKTTDE